MKGWLRVITFGLFAGNYSGAFSAMRSSPRIARPTAHSVRKQASSITGSRRISSRLSADQGIAGVTSEGVAADVLSTQDIVVGTFMAFVLAFGYSYLNGQSSSSNFVSWGSVSKDVNDKSKPHHVEGDSLEEGGSPSEGVDKVFDATSWKEISRPENYVLYQNRIRDGKKSSVPNAHQNISERVDERKEKKFVFIGLLILFVPIFSAEFFLALSRQFMCSGNPFTQAEWARQLCLPYTGS